MLELCNDLIQILGWVRIYPKSNTQSWCMYVVYRKYCMHIRTCQVLRASGSGNCKHLIYVTFSPVHSVQND